MLKNLLESWAALAPDEVNLSKDYTELSLRRNTEEHGIIVVGTTEPLMVYEQDVLQGYIQRCIEARGWGIRVSRTQDDELNWFVEVEINTYNSNLEDPTYKVCKHGEVIYLALLQCYLKALAAQRVIAPGSWQHYQENIVEVVGVFPFGTKDVEDDNYTVEGTFTLADDPNLSFQLLCWGDGHMELRHTPLSLGYLPDMVAYFDFGKGYLALPKDFLGLVDSGNSEEQGKLRFVEGARSV